MGLYTFQITTKRTARAEQRAAVERFRQARAAWHAGDKTGDFPSHTLEECTWIATAMRDGWVWSDGGSTERIAVQRAVALALKGKHP